MPGSEPTCRWIRAGHGSGASANRRPISGWFPGRPPLLAGRWPGTTGLTSYPSRCVPFCSRATAFSLPPVFRRLPGLCQALCPPRFPHPFALPPCDRWIFWRAFPAGTRVACWFAVATSTLTWVRSLRFPHGAKLPADFHSARQRFLIVTRRGISNSHFRTGATRHGEIRELCPVPAFVSADFHREPGTPAAPGFSPV